MKAIITMSALLCAFAALAQEPDKSRLSKPSTAFPEPYYALLNVNNLTTWLRADGQSNHSPRGDNGTYFPRGTRINVVYQDGIVWGGRAYLDSAKSKPAPYNQIIRAGGTTYATGTRAGHVLGFGSEAVPVDPNTPTARIYRIRRDYFFMTPTEKRRDAAEYYEARADTLRAEQIAALHAQYEKDWREWPVELGAPFVDRNGNGKYDSPPPFAADFTPDDLILKNYDEPGLACNTPEFPADQVIWTVYNDLHIPTALGRFGSNPLGLEVQVTLWGYKSSGVMGNTFFRRTRFINKGGVEIDEAGNKGAFWIDSTYVGLFSDPDLGYHGDDLVGCDTLLQAGFAYNSAQHDTLFENHGSPPTAGYVLLQGPKVLARGQTAWFDWKRLPQHRNLPLAAFAYLVPMLGDPQGGYDGLTIPYYKMLRGFMPFASPERYFPFPPDMTSNPFPLSGDPVKRTGFIDGLGTPYSVMPSDRRFILSTGPFAFAPGDTQEVVHAFVAALGADRLSSIAVMKFFVKHLRSWYPGQGLFADGKGFQEPEPILPIYYMLAPNYPNPFNGKTRIAYTLPQPATVRLAIYDVLGREIEVLAEGQFQAGTYNVSWEGRDRNGNVAPSGVYFYRLQANHLEIVRKLALVR